METKPLPAQTTDAASLPSLPDLARAEAFLLTRWPDVIAALDVRTGTREKYTRNAADFVSFLKDNGGLHYNIYRAYKKHLQSITSLSAKTKNVRLAAAKVLLSEMYTHYRLLPFDLSAGVKFFQVSQAHVRDGLTAKEARKVLAEIGKLKGPTKTRLTAVFALLAWQGLRQYEVCNLQAEDLHLADKQLSVLGKGRDDREKIDLHPATVKALQAYCDAFQVKSGPLFFSLSGNRKDRLSERSVRRMFSGLFARAGIEGRTVHGFRHYFVTELLSSKKFDLFEIAKFSRHKTVSTLQRYDDRKKRKELLPAFYSVFSHPK